MSMQEVNVNTEAKEPYARRSCIESEVDLAADSWVLAYSLRPGDLVKLARGGEAFIVADWVGCIGGYMVFSMDGQLYHCASEFPYVLMVQADFMRCNFPASDIF